MIYKSDTNNGRNWQLLPAKEYSNDLIYKYLTSNQPCMVSRFGANEISCMINYIGVKTNNKSWLEFMRGNSLKWWWDSMTLKKMGEGAGFFPNEINKLEMFCELMFEDITQIDILGSWLKEEKYFSSELSKAKRVMLEDLEPFFTKNPWTRALEGKRVLVVHPFADTIEQQYKIRHKLFDNNLLPDFELTTIKAVQSIAGTKTEFSDWFDALSYMKSQIDIIDFDICIVGCGAYGLPLAAYVKRIGKKSIHLAGATQLLFGIKGKRWENYIVWPYTNLFNENWVRPGDLEKPRNASQVENACYW